MLTLALDTTTRGGSVAVARGHTVLSIVHGDPARTHGERLPGELDRALAEAGIAIRDVELLAVASGPGAFTGLRIGLATIQGLALVMNLPVVTVSALDALALAARRDVAREGADQPPDRGPSPPRGEQSSRRGPSPPIAAWMDAQRGEVFATYYPPGPDVERPSAHAAPIVAAPDIALSAIPDDLSVIFIGDGVVRYREQILQRRPAAHTQIADLPVALAPFIATIGQVLARNGEVRPPHAVQPLYVRRPDAELERLRKAAE